MESHADGPDGWELVIDVWRFLNTVFDGAEPVFSRHGLHQKSLVLLALLDLTDSPQGLAELLRSPASSLSSLIKDVEAKGLIERRLHPDDRRRHVLTRTGSGDAALAEGVAAIRACVAREFALSSPEEKAAVGPAQRMMRRIAGTKA
jgi:DNA-binding MarR family transcriptional regulator